MLSAETGFSDFYKRCDAYAVRWQRRHLTAEKAQLAALVGAALFANFGRPGRLAAVVCFLIALIGSLYRAIEKTDQKWWNGRAGAESAKTLCWRYCVGGMPFGTGRGSGDVRFSQQILEVANKVAEISPVPSGEAHVTDEMREVRRLPLADRIVIYRTQRIGHQMKWYASKSDVNASRSTRWTLAIVTAQGIGLGLAVLLSSIEFDFAGLLSSMAAAGLAWTAVKQYDVLERSYSVASNELASIDVAIGARTWTEDEWAHYVDDAEEAISREHTSWRASRAV